MIANVWISFTTDYGLDDGFVAACEGVIARIAPEARVLHVTHAIPAQDVRRGAAVLADTVPYLPAGVHVAVVDPDVGTERRPVVVVAAGGLLVGPDNGLLVPAAERLGGVLAAYELREPVYRLESVSATFHGRDVFAPAAAHLLTGVPPERFGPAIEPGTLVRLPEPETVAAGGLITTEVRTVDHFGNIQLAATTEDLGRAGFEPGVRLRISYGGRSVVATAGRTFADVPAGQAVLYPDSAGRLTIAVNTGSATASLGTPTGPARVQLEPDG
jgi:S-adenosyl-L-methionine hydrolase (adenosine-forming)